MAPPHGRAFYQGTPFQCAFGSPLESTGERQQDRPPAPEVPGGTNRALLLRLRRTRTPAAIVYCYFRAQRASLWKTRDACKDDCKAAMQALSSMHPPHKGDPTRWIRLTKHLDSQCSVPFKALQRSFVWIPLFESPLCEAVVCHRLACFKHMFSFPEVPAGGHRPERPMPGPERGGAWPHSEHPLKSKTCAPT